MTTEIQRERRRLVYQKKQGEVYEITHMSTKHKTSNEEKERKKNIAGGGEQGGKIRK